MNALCPACRRPYTDEDIQFKPVSQEEIQKIKGQKKRKEKERKEVVGEKKQLGNVRVVQKNLVYVLGLPPKLCTEEVLRSGDYFGQYGKITKVVVNRKTNNQNTGVYITYLRKDDAQKAIEQVDGSNFEGKVIRATFGTTKYCSYFLKGMSCQNIGCQFLHESGEDAESFLREENRLYNQRVEKGMKVAFASNNNNQSSTDQGVWKQSAAQAVQVLKNQQQFPMLGELPEPKLKQEMEILGSLSLGDNNEQFVPDMTLPLTLKKAKLLLFPRYNGLFDPFGSDRLLKTLMALVEEKQLDEVPDGRRSRYERIFEEVFLLIGQGRKIQYCKYFKCW